jgi:capsular polysaccharide biosynthesis protein
MDRTTSVASLHSPDRREILPLDRRQLKTPSPVSHLLKGVETLARFGIRFPRPIVRILGRLLGRMFVTYQRRIGWAGAARRAGFSGVCELARRPRSVAGLRHAERIHDAFAVSFSDPRHLRYLGHGYTYPGNRQRFLPSSVHCLERAFVHVRTGAVATADRTLIVESVRGKVARFVNSAKPLGEPRFLSGAATTIQTHIHTNYYHWMIDCLPRTFLLAKAGGTGPVRLLVPDRLASFQRITLECCRPDGTDVTPLDDEWVQVEQLVFPSYVSQPATGFLPADCLAYLRGRIFDAVGPLDDAPPRRRLYISRSGTAWRRIVNEPEIVERLAQYGFEVCQPDRLTFEEQVRLFYSAQVIVGARGAGLTNMLFARHAKLLELTTPVPLVGSHYFSLAYALGHDYHYLFARRRIGRDLDVDPRALEQTLAEMDVLS